jgi:hypothetical protein
MTSDGAHMILQSRTEAGQAFLKLHSALGELSGNTLVLEAENTEIADAHLQVSSLAVNVG